MKKTLCLIVAFTSMVLAGASSGRFESRSPAARWQDSLLTGNGTIGAMVEGRISNEVIHLSHAKLYLPQASDPELATRDPFMAACDLRIANDVDACGDYLRYVDFATGECVVTARDVEGRVYSRRLFASRTDNLIAIKISDPAKRETFFVLDSLPLEGCREARTFESGVRRFEVGKRDGCLFYSCEFSKRNQWNDLAGYVVALAAGADKSEAFVAIEPIPKDGFSTDPFPAIRKRLGAAVADGYDALLSRHEKAMRDLFSRVSLDIESDDDRVVRYFSAGRYNIISSTGGDNVPNLQGIWGGSWSEPWGDTFKENGHLPCATAFYNRGATPEFNECLLKWLERKSKDPRHRWHGSAWFMPARLRDAYRHTLDEDWLRRVEPILKDAATRPAPDPNDVDSLLSMLSDDALAEIVTNATLRRIVRDAVDSGLERGETALGSRIAAFGYVRLGLAACKLGEAGLAEMCLKILTDDYWTAGGGTLHHEGDIFNMDLSGGYPYLVTEMLVHGEDGWANFLPAKPRSWRKGSVKGLVLRGAVRLEDLSWEGTDWTARLRFRDGTEKTVTSAEAPLGVVWYEKLK